MTNAQSRAFLYLTMAAAVMIIINITQAFLINHLHTMAWILAFPLSVFVILLALIASRTAFSYENVRIAWNAASGADRAAWLGAILSIVLPIIVCQFLYLPLVALPSWHRTTWTMSLHVDETLPLPGVVILYQGISVMSILDLWCWTDRAENCTISNVERQAPQQPTGTWQYFWYNPVGSDTEKATWTKSSLIGFEYICEPGISLESQVRDANSFRQ